MIKKANRLCVGWIILLLILISRFAEIAKSSEKIILIWFENAPYHPLLLYLVYFILNILFKKDWLYVFSYQIKKNLNEIEFYYNFHRSLDEL
jgi:hypothetical protein